MTSACADSEIGATGPHDRKQTGADEEELDSAVPGGGEWSGRSGLPFATAEDRRVHSFLFTGIEITCCPVCGKGQLACVRELHRARDGPA